MGLDMFLYAERYISEYFAKGDDKKEEEIRKLFPELKDFRITKLSSEVGYWRKANAIHNWFVENVQSGVDDCDTYDVPREKIKELIELVKEVLKTSKNKRRGKSVAKSILPTKSGFFFGGIEIDEYYYEDMRNTLNILEGAIKLPKTYSFKYRASW